jgi:hypothetical protein
MSFLVVPKIAKISEFSNKNIMFLSSLQIGFHVSTFYQFQKNMLQYQYVSLLFNGKLQNS